MHFHFFILILAIVFMPFNVSAKVEVMITDEEKPVFAFFRMADRYPDFKYWAETMPSVMGARDEFELSENIEREYTRLKWGFGTYDEKKEFLKVRAPIELSIQERDGQKTLHFDLIGMLDQNMPFFPYTYGVEAVALLPQGLGNFNGFTLNADGAARIEKYMGGRERLSAFLKLRVRPLSADVSAPVIVDNINFWMLSGDIAYLAFEIQDVEAGGAERLLMEYTAPWYLSKSEEALIDLLGH